jgi:type III secretion protein D
MDSLNMKKLRILTGRHAGANVDLSPGNHSIGNQENDDICITDWTGEPLQISVAPNHVVVQPVGDEAGQPWIDFNTRTFDAVALCVGPAQGPWPADIELLAEAFPPTPKRIASWAGAKLRLYSFAAVVTVTLVAATVLTAITLRDVDASPLPQQVQESPQTAQQRLSRLLEANGFRGVQIARSDEALAIEGWVGGPAEATALRAVLREAKSSVAWHARFNVASDVAESLRSGTGFADAQVRHLGDGVFQLSAKVADIDAAQQTVARVSADLAAVVKRVDTELTQLEQAKPSVPVLASFRDDELSIVQTRDGVKHLVIAPQPLQAASLPATAAPQSAQQSQVTP